MQNTSHTIYKLDLLPLKGINEREDLQKMYEIPLQAETIAVHNGLFMCRKNALIKVYKYSENFTLSLIKTYNKSSLAFSERLLSKAATTLMYKIMLDLTSKDVEINEIETYLAELMDSLEFNKIKAVEYTNQFIIIKYKDNLIRICDSRLCPVEVDQKIIEKNIEDDKKISVKAVGNKIVLKFNGNSILSKSIGNIVSMDRTGDNVFLLLESKLAVISLS